MEAKKEKIVISLLISIAVLLWFINQYLTIQLYSQTAQYVKNQELSKYYEQSNNQLKLYLLQRSSYNFLEQQAQKQGYVPATFIYLDACGDCASMSP